MSLRDEVHFPCEQLAVLHRTLPLEESRTIETMMMLLPFCVVAFSEDIASEMRHLKVGEVVSRARKFFCDNLVSLQTFVFVCWLFILCTSYV